MSAQVNRGTRLRRAGFLSIAGAALAAAGLASASGSNAAPEPAPDLILFHGRVLTVDSHDSIAQGIAIRDGKIIAVGADRDILAMAGAATHRIDLHGRTATPGLIDSHAHIADAGLIELYHVDLSDASSVAEVVRRVKARIAGLKPGE